MAGAAGMTASDGRRRRPRRCIALREARDRSELLRFVVDPEGQVVPDVEARLPGRGLWLSARRDVIDRAVARNLFAKALRGRARVEGDLVGRIEAMLAARLRDLLGLARRAGQAAIGFDQAHAALKAGRAAGLVIARDAGDDGRRRLAGLGEGVPVVAALGREEIGRALGRGPTVYVALAPGGLAERLVAVARRLEGLRPGSLEGRRRIRT